MSASNETLDCQFVTTGNETVFGEMLSKRSIQEASVAIFLNDMIDEAELQSILEITNKKNPSFPYWKYDRIEGTLDDTCLLYTSPSPRDQRGSRMPSSA